MNDIIEFFTDPLRLTLLVAAVVVILAIFIFGRRSQRIDASLSRSHSNRDFRFNNPPPDLLVDEEVIVLPPRKKAGEVKSDESMLTDEAVTMAGVEEFSAVETTAAPTAVKNSKIEARQTADVNQEIPMNTFEYQQKKAAVHNSQSTAAMRTQQEERAETESDMQETAAAKPVLERFIVFHVIPTQRDKFLGKDILQVASQMGMAFGKHNVYHYPADMAREGNSQFCLVNMTSGGTFDKESLQTLETRGVSLILRLSDETKDGLALFSNMLAIAQGMSRRLGGEIQDQTRASLTPEIVTSLRGDVAKFQTQLNQRKQRVTEV